MLFKQSRPNKYSLRHFISFFNDGSCPHGILIAETLTMNYATSASFISMIKSYKSNK